MQTTEQIIAAKETMEGDSATVWRLFPLKAERMNYDPFVLWDHFSIEAGAGFPEHPHRGFEAITYLFNGGIEHKDNIGNQSTVYAQGAQRFTAGRGLIHSEMPVETTISEGIQVWINLPRHLKQVDPAYQQVDAINIPEENIEGVVVRKIADQQQGIQLLTPVQYLDIQFTKGQHYNAKIPPKQRGFAYVVNGSVSINDAKVDTGEAYFFEQLSQDLAINAELGSRIMLISGEPHRQPIYQYGPFVD